MMDTFDIDNGEYTPTDLSMDGNRYAPGSHTYRGDYNEFDEPVYQPVPVEPPRHTTGTTTQQPGQDRPRPTDMRQDRPQPRPQERPIDRSQTEQRASTASQQQRKQKVLEQRPKAKRPNPILTFLRSENLRIFTAIALIVISVFMVIAVVSHFHSGAEDQSITANLSLQQISEDPDMIQNVTGGFGAWISKVLLCDALGLGSLVLIVYLWLISFSLLGLRKCQFWATTFRCLLVAISSSIVLGLLTYNMDTVIYWGGNHGHYVNQFLISRANWIGAIAVSLLLIAAVCCVYLNELRLLWNKYQTLKERRRLQEQLKRERQRKLDSVDDEQQNETAPNDSDDVLLSVDGDLNSKNNSSEQQNSTQSKTLSEKMHSLIDKLRIPKGDGTAESAEGANQTGQAVTGTNVTQQVVKGYNNDLLIIDSNDGDKPRVQTGQTENHTTDNTTTQIGESFTINAPQIEIATEGEIDIDVESVDEGLYDHKAELSRYQLPTPELLEDRPSGCVIDMAEQQANKERIEKTLLDYKIPIQRIKATIGPTVTLYEIVPAEGIRIQQIKRLEDDIALSLSALGIRIIAPIPGKGTVGIEVPNNDPQTVSMRSVISSKKFQECRMALPMAMGSTISNEIFIADLAKMPHLLVAGATGMGKSVGLNAIITSLLYKKHPSELKFVLVDPKMVEFSLYSKLERHYLAKLPNEEDAIITDMKKVIETLNALCVEMDNRYELLRDANVRSLEEYNKKFTERRLNPEKGHQYLPYLVVIVDEFADLIMTQGKEVETPISRIAQKARAVGIHMILATQRPSTNVITGLIKANFPGRIAFRVIQMVDSRTILDCPGANQLIGRGDMLFSHNGNMTRVQCAFISTEEVEAVTQFIDDQVGYEHAYYLPEYVPEESEGGIIAGASSERDTLFDEAARFVVSRQMGSTSSLQRQFSIGYNRAGKLMDQLEAAGIVGQVNGAKPRSILVDMMTLESILAQ